MKKDNQLPAYYPIFLNIRGQKCVVVGGGQVALRKAKALLEHRASVTVISLVLCAELAQLAETGKIRVYRREFQEGDLAGALVAIAATNNREVNFKIAEEGQRHRVLVNVVDDTENSNFIVPSLLRRGDVTIAVSTAGRSPALARKIRGHLERDFGDEYASLARLVAEVRAEVKKQGIKISGDAWQASLDLDLMIDLLRKKEDGKAKAILLSNLKSQPSYD